MNTSILSTRKVTNIGIGFLFVLLAALALSSCSSKARAEEQDGGETDDQANPATRTGQPARRAPATTGRVTAIRVMA